MQTNPHYRLSLRYTRNTLYSVMGSMNLHNQGNRTTPQSCSVCKHPERAAIEAALLRNVSLRKIAEEHGASAWSIHKHSKHVARVVAKAVSEEARQVTEASNLLSRVESLLDECREIAKHAKESKAWPAAVAALREVRSCVELLARLRGELKQAGTQVNVAVGVNVNQSGADEGDGNLELVIARYTEEATGGFDPVAIRRMQMLLARESKPPQGVVGPQDLRFHAFASTVCTECELSFAR